jgi:Cdc6-like AAA superfamily ATPase
MRVDNQKYHEVLNLMANFHHQRPEAAPKNTHYIPFTESSRFWGREDILASIDDALLADHLNRSLRSFALHGMGGVGKTQIALKYANASREKFDGVFWISAENSITIRQSFREIAKRLGLIKPDTETDDNAVMLEVKRWLSSTSESSQIVCCDV